MMKRLNVSAKFGEEVVLRDLQSASFFSKQAGVLDAVGSGLAWLPISVEKAVVISAQE